MLTEPEIMGPAGAIEARWHRAPVEPPDVVVVMCHPHPQYGGNMDDAVLHTCAAALTDPNRAPASRTECLKFNFRGVGASAGGFDQGVGELEDLQAVVAWIGVNLPKTRLWLLGYSFGANIVWQTALRDASPVPVDRVFLIAPPLDVMTFADAEPGRHVHCHLLVGDRDDFCTAQSLARWTGKRPADDPASRAIVIAGADHFFSGCHAELGSAVSELLET